MLLVAAATAVVAGLMTFYVGKNFGTPMDYLSVILTGAGIETLGKGLLETFKQLKKPLKV